jgi:hypothetical protein
MPRIIREHLVLRDGQVCEATRYAKQAHSDKQRHHANHRVPVTSAIAREWDVERIGPMEHRAIPTITGTASVQGDARARARADRQRATRNAKR